MKHPDALEVSKSAPYAFQNPSAFPADGVQFWKTRLAVLKGMKRFKNGQYTRAEMQDAIEQAQAMLIACKKR